jgi:hypothetical protein
MGKIVLVARLVARDIRRHKAQAVLLLLAITAATTTLVLGLALNGVTNHPYHQTRALTNGPDLVAGYGVSFGSPGQGPPAAVSAAQLQADTRALTHLSGVANYSGPYPVASVILRTRGLTVPVEAEGRSQAPASVDQPKLTAGSWMRPGGVVIERAFAEALGVGVGDRVTLDGRPFTVTGIAVTAAAAPYPDCYLTSCMFTGRQTGPSSSNLSTLNVGLTWVAEADARALASPQAPLSYILNLKLKDPATAPAVVNQVFANGGIGAAISRGIDSVYSWQDISSAAGQLVQDEQGVLRVGALLAVLLAVARSVTPWSPGTPRCWWWSRPCWLPWPGSTRSAPPGPRCWTTGVPRRWPARLARPRVRSAPGSRGPRCCPRCWVACWASRWASRCSRPPTPGR